MRIISRLDAKPPYIVKPIYFEGVKKIGLPSEFVEKYNKQIADEIIYIDIVSSLYQRPIKFNEIKRISRLTSIPLSVGGGIKKLRDAERIINYGADKVIVNTHLFSDISLLREMSKSLGSQACVAHIQAKKVEDKYECLTDCGRNRTETDVFSWLQVLEDNGVGEIMISSVDNDGAMKGFDLELAEKAINSVNVPVIIGSGCGKLEDILELKKLNPSGIAVGSALHYDKLSIKDIKMSLDNS
tara:strand:+ start:938 stop:1663 length:726 start_codon:yes stop_codon:yes gene_type:complete